MNRLIAAIAIASATVTAVPALAQTQTQPIPGAPASAAKKELAQRLLTLQQPALESMGRDLVDRPARQMMGAAEEALQARVPPEKREAVVKQIEEQLRKYRDESQVIAKDRAVKVGQSSLGPVFEEKFTEDELKQLVAALESPAYKKFQQALPELTNTYAQNLVKDLEPSIQPKLKALEDSVASALGVTTPQAGAPGTPAAPKAATPARPARPAASQPAKK